MFIVFLSFPVMVTFMLFYLCKIYISSKSNSSKLSLGTVTALSSTQKFLESRRQMSKLRLYNRLFYMILVMILAILVMMILSLSYALNRNYWRSLWFWSSGWLNIIFFFAMCWILWLWRPTRHNDRLGLEELPTEMQTEGNEPHTLWEGDADREGSAGSSIISELDVSDQHDPPKGFRAV
jgi:Kef-type K+ transport system membrane component KefB